MRNASDIFCLNEDVTDGTQMFSVNGSCPLKIRRRTQPRENECFEYGRSIISEELDRGDAKPEKVDLQKGDLENLRMADELEKASAAKGDEETTRRDGIVAGTSYSHRQMERERGSVQSPSVTMSNMQRNPLTGAGMEIKQHKKPKKGLEKSEKWVW
ncbi:hypothetical protein JTB14_004364 [Gonioctena quinquepunctata]|nr:hypothetical protein JTB14_004364 [Gonioctena quinquepunctata]